MPEDPSGTILQKAAGAIAHWLGITSTLVATATAIFTTQLAVSVNERNARDRFFEKQLGACTDLGDASLPLQSAIREVGAGYVLKSLGQKELAKEAFDKGATQVTATYSDYQKIMTRLFVLYPDSFVSLEGKVVQFLPTTLRSRADQAPDPTAAFEKLRNGFSDADVNLRQACTNYLRRYAKANLMNRD
jgi:hypothetical protein